MSQPTHLAKCAYCDQNITIYRHAVVHGEVSDVCYEREFSNWLDVKAHSPFIVEPKTVRMEEAS